MACPSAVVQFVKGGMGDRRARACSTRFADLVTSSTRWARASPGRRRTASATSPPPAPPGRRRKALIRDPTIRLVLLDELNIVLRYDYLPLDEVLAFLRAEAGRYACHRHRPQRQARADRDRRSGHGDDAGEASLPLRREGAGRDRVLTGAARTPASCHDPGHRLECRQVADRRRAVPRLRPTAACGSRRSSRRTCRTTPP